MFGDEANPLRALLDINYPIKEGMIKDNPNHPNGIKGDWEDFEKLWHYTFHTKMGLPEDLSDKCILVTEAALQPKKNREKMADLIFDKFGFGYVMFETQALLSLMAEGKNTGCVLDSGDGVTHIIPVIEGQV